ncbi:TPA: hypothetical protein HA244_05430 [Candidatus Micrarchaeota archaeon]|nr:hypothetical protein [Candidatus Micrarchaeota archaeon]
MKTLVFTKELPTEALLKKISKKYVWSLLVYLSERERRFYDLETEFLRNKRELSHCLKILKEFDLISRTHISKKDRDYLAYETTPKGRELIKRLRELKKLLTAEFTA